MADALAELSSVDSPAPPTIETLPVVIRTLPVAIDSAESPSTPLVDRTTTAVTTVTSTFDDENFHTGSADRSQYPSLVVLLLWIA